MACVKQPGVQRGQHERQSASGSEHLSWARGLPRWHSWSRTFLPMQQRQEMQIQSVGGEDPLEKEMATHSHILTGKIPQTEEPGGLQSMGLQRVGHD